MCEDDDWEFDNPFWIDEEWVGESFSCKINYEELYDPEWEDSEELDSFLKSFDIDNER